MTIDEYSDTTGALEEDFGPSIDPEEQAMIDHLIEYETEMFRLDCRRRISGLPYRWLVSMMIDLHGKEWRDAL